MAKQIIDTRRVIGPIPPRTRDGKLRLVPDMGKKVKVNALNEPIRDKDGQPIEVEADLRDERDYRIWEPGMVAAPEAVKGLKVFQVDLPGEPLVQVYARHEDEAFRVWKSEMGIVRLMGSEDPKVKEIPADGGR